MGRKIEAIEAEFRAFGYFVSAEPIPGSEDLFADSLFDGLEKMRQQAAVNAKRYGYRGRSKRALSALHADLPEPAWGVSVA